MTILAPLIKTVAAVILFNFADEFFNPMVGGIRMNIMGHESFGTWKELEENIELKCGITLPPDSYNPIPILTQNNMYRDLKNLRTGILT